MGRGVGKLSASGAESKLALLEVILPMALGRSWTSPAAAWADLTQRTRRNAIQSGEPGPFAACIAGIEVALSDLAARKAGLPRRPWVEHVLYAPGWYTGYGAKTMPGVTEAIEDGRFDEAKQQMVIVTNAVNAEAEHLEGIVKELGAQ